MHNVTMLAIVEDIVILGNCSNFNMCYETSMRSPHKRRLPCTSIFRLPAPSRWTHTAPVPFHCRKGLQRSRRLQGAPDIPPERSPHNPDPAWEANAVP